MWIEKGGFSTGSEIQVIFSMTFFIGCISKIE